MKSHILIISLLLLAGCDYYSSSTDFQLATSNDGKVYRLNTKTGEVRVISNGILIKVHESNRIALTKNVILEAENKDAYQYKGNGKFVKRDLSDPENIAKDMLNEMGL